MTPRSEAGGLLCACLRRTRSFVEESVIPKPAPRPGRPPDNPNCHDNPGYSADRAVPDSVAWWRGGRQSVDGKDRGATMDDQAAGASGPDALAASARADPIAGDLVTETFEYDGGREVTVYVPPDPPEAIVFAGDGQLIGPWGMFLEAAD